MKPVDLSKFLKSYKKTVIVFLFALVIISSLAITFTPIVHNNLLVHSAVAADPAPAAPKPAAPADSPQAVESEGFVTSIIGGIVNIFSSFISKIVVIFVGFLINIGQYNSFTTAKVVITGWNVVRDIANMFFVLMLLMISFGTILGLEQYQLKKLLPKVVLMAILVNFSKAISGLLIDFSQVILLTFASAYQTMGEGNLLSVLGMDKIGKLGKDTSYGNWELVAAYLLGLAYSVAALIAVGAFVLIFVVRIVMLWILIILSPMAYVLSIVPIGQKYASQWWSDFSKYVIVGPVIAFFLWLSLATLGPTVSDISEIKKNEGKPGVTVGATIAGSDEHIYALIISIAMLMASLMMAQEVGSVVGKIAGSAVSKLQSGGIKAAMLPFKAARGVASYAEGTLYENTGIGLDPRRVWRGAKGYFERRRGEKETVGQKKAADRYKELMEKGSGNRAVAMLALGATEDALQIFTKGTAGWNRLQRTLGNPSRYSKQVYEEGEEARIVAKEKVKEAEAMKGEHEMLADGRIAARKEAEAELVKGKTEAVQKALPLVMSAVEEHERTSKSIDDEERVVAEEEEDLRRQGKSDNEIKEATKVHRAEIKAKRKTADDKLNDKIAAVATRSDIGLTPQELDSVLYQQERDDKGQNLAKKVSILDKMRSNSILTPDQTRAVSGPERKDHEKRTNKFIEDVAKDTGEELVKNNPVFQDLLADQMDQMGYGEQGKETEDEKRKLKDKAKDEYAKEKAKIQADLDYMKKGGYSEEQKRKVDSRIEDLLRKLVAIDKSIADAKNNGKDTEQLARAKTSMITELSEQKMKQKQIEDRTPLNEVSDAEEIKNNKESNKDAIREARFRIAELKGYEQQDDNEENIKKRKDKLKKEAAKKTKKSLAKSEAVPQTFYADRAYRTLESQEMSKLPKESMEWEELGDLLERALQEKNMLQISTFMKKAAEDYNDNEIYKDNGLESGPAGAELFRKQRLEKTFGKQGSMQLASEMAYINEAHNHNNVSRMYGMKNGMYYVRTREQQAAAAATENLKQDSRKFIQNHNRLGYGFEDAQGKFHLDLSGKLTLAGFQDDFSYRLDRAEVNPSLIMKLSEDVGALYDMQRRGMLTAKLPSGETIAEAIDRMGRHFKKRGVGTNYSALKEQAVSLM